MVHGPPPPIPKAPLDPAGEDVPGRLRRLVVSTYQAVSGMGRTGNEELLGVRARPVLTGPSMTIDAEFDEPISADEARAFLAGAVGVEGVGVPTPRRGGNRGDAHRPGAAR